MLVAWAAFLGPLVIAAIGWTWLVLGRHRRAGLWLGAASCLAIVVVALVGSDLGLQKAASRLVMPAGLVWVGGWLATLRWIARRQWKAGRAMLIACLAYTALGNAWIAGWVTRCVEGRVQAPREIVGRLDAILILGGGATVAEDGDAQVTEHGDRVVLAARLFRRGVAPILVTSGQSIASLYGARDLTEATAQIWLELGIPDDAIVRLSHAENTSQEIRAFSALVKERGWNRVGLLTSALHLPRAERLAARESLDVVPIAALRPHAALPFHPAHLVPSPGAFLALQAAAWELLGAAVGR